MTTLCFHTTVSTDGTITLPPEFCGKSVRIAVEQELVHKTGILSIAGILQDCDIESVEADAPMKSPVQDLLDFCTKDVSLCTDEGLDNDRYEYLKEKYR